MNLLLLILLSPLACVASQCVSVSALVRVAVFCGLCFLWRMANKYAILFFFSCLPTFASVVPLAWNANPSVGVTNYVLYAQTNQAPATNCYVWRISVGTELETVTKNLTAGIWYFTITVEANGEESDFSNIAIVEVRPKDPGTKTIVLEYNPDLLGTNWTKLGFFRLEMP